MKDLNNARSNSMWWVTFISTWNGTSVVSCNPKKLQIMCRLMPLSHLSVKQYTQHGLQCNNGSSSLSHPKGGGHSYKSKAL